MGRNGDFTSISRKPTKMVETQTPLRAGDLVLSGALGPMVPVAAGDHYQVEIQGFPTFSFKFR